MTTPASNALYTRVPRETRYKGKNFVETAVWRFGDVVVTSGVSVLGKVGVAVERHGLDWCGRCGHSCWVARAPAASPDLVPEGNRPRSSQEVGAVTARRRRVVISW